MHHFQTLVDLTEGLTDPLVQRIFQFFIDGAAHFIEFFLVAQIDGRQFFIDGETKPLSGFVADFRQRRDLLDLAVVHLIDLTVQRAVDLQNGTRRFLPVGPGFSGVFRFELPQFLPKLFDLLPVSAVFP